MRLEQLHEHTFSDDQRSLFDSIAQQRSGEGERPRHLVGPAGDVRGPFNHMLLAPEFGAPLQELGGALRSASSLEPLARELVILMAARSWRSEFEWWAHLPIGRAAGMTDTQVDAILAGEVPSVDDARTQAAVEAAQAILERSDLDDDEYARAHAALGTVALIELTTLIGYYAMAAMQMRVFRVEPPDAEPRAFDR